MLEISLWPFVFELTRKLKRESRPEFVWTVGESNDESNEEFPNESTAFSVDLGVPGPALLVFG